MRSFARQVFLVYLFCLCLPVLIHAQTAKETPAKVPRNAGWAASEKAVTKLEQEWFKVQLAHDWDKLRQLLGDDFQLIESDGRLGDRARRIYVGRGGVTGVLIDGEGSATGAGFVVADSNGEQIAALARGEGILKRAEREWPASFK